MDVTAYTYGAGTKVELGKVAEQIWVNGFRSDEERTIQVSRPINAPRPNLFDRLTVMESFSFAAGRSFGPSATAVADALNFLRTHRKSVPVIADIQFTQQGAEMWLQYCGIKKITLIEKNSALVVFGYEIIGGSFAATRT